MEKLDYFFQYLKLEIAIYAGNIFKELFVQKKAINQDFFLPSSGKTRERKGLLFRSP